MIGGMAPVGACSLPTAEKGVERPCRSLQSRRADPSGSSETRFCKTSLPDQNVLSNQICTSLVDWSQLNPKSYASILSFPI